MIKSGKSNKLKIKQTMKYFLLLFLFFISQITFSQNKTTENKKIEHLIHIWGLLKYQHPEVSKGIFDMNNEFINQFDKIQNIESPEKLNDAFLIWIKKFDTNKLRFRSNSKLLSKKNFFIKNANYNWIENSGFNSELVDLLNEMQTNSNIGHYYASIDNLSKMVSFKNEKGFDKFDSTIKSHRILFLSSFWNKMNYWNVNIYLTEKPWSKVLEELISDFIVNDSIQFELAKEKLFSKLNDSHANYDLSYSLKKLNRFAYFGCKIVNDSLVITNVYNKEIAEKNNIDLGDVVYKIEGQNVRDYYLAKFSNSISVSNENYLKSAIGNYFLLASDKDSIQINLCKKNGVKETKFVALNDIKSFPKDNKLYQSLVTQKAENFYNLNNETGYLNLGNITKSELKKAFKEFENKKGIVIDLRNYPVNIGTSEIATYLYPEKKIFIKILGPKIPSYGEYGIDVPLKLIINPFAAGGTNKNYYKGKIILLVNRKTASNAEFIGMAIQQAPSCTTIGEQTFGAVMNRNRIILIDKTTIDFTAMGAFYPNDEEVQRKGLKIDYQIKESAVNYNPNLYIETAMQLLEN